MSSIRTIFVPYDFSEYSEAALAVADGLAQQLEADLHLFHLLQPPLYLYASEFGMGFASSREVETSQLDEINERLDGVAARCRVRRGQIHVHVVEGTGIAQSIETEAERVGADLIAMGTHGRTGLAHLWMGSVAEETIRRAPCPVLAVPRQAGATAHPIGWEVKPNRASDSL
jgi:nucleotide-binding universal stress UspA family protein